MKKTKFSAIVVATVVSIAFVCAFACGCRGALWGDWGGLFPDPPIPTEFDPSTLQDKMLSYEGAIGLPSVGSYHALVIPVQFQGDTITEEQLENLEAAFNGTEEETGWQSVKTYYQTASYGKLDLTFDIQSVYEAEHDADYYEEYSEDYVEGGYTYTRTGEEVILTEALDYFEDRIDLTKYDFNHDDTIDAVYLIYSAPVDYYEGDFYWAYVTWYYGENTYDGLNAFYFLFAGIDFMYENTERVTIDEEPYNEIIDGLEINASTYIHETGHLLGLDDYYDYQPRKGCNEGLGGADMMDFTVGDHNVYSKTVLGWLTPTRVEETATLELKSSAKNPSAILVPLNWNNSYFCEYLLIDLYVAKGLNEMHASMTDSLLYDGAAYGVRIYHVSSFANKPYSTDYMSFTNYNNTDTAYALIKLVEADGEKKFASSNGYASYTDLWQTGSSFKQKFPSYKTNGGKKLGFDILIDSVSAEGASITITFDQAV